MIGTFLVAATMLWGQGNLPACGVPRYEVRPLTTVWPGRVAMGEARADTCLVTLAPAVFLESEAQLCTFVVHEVGHLFGQEHRPRGVMAAVPRVLSRMCVRLARAFA